MDGGDKAHVTAPTFRGADVGVETCRLTRQAEELAIAGWLFAGVIGTACDPQGDADGKREGCILHGGGKLAMLLHQRNSWYH